MKQTATREQYLRAFELERTNRYPMAEAFENTMGYPIERARLEELALTLACPVKANPPNWQHGRMLYALTRAYLEKKKSHVLLLDIGTAKGFSALIMAWALHDARAPGRVVSVDISYPEERIIRNSVAECDRGPMTLKEFTAGLRPPGVDIEFCGGGSLRLLDQLLDKRERVGLAFVDGKHTKQAVKTEGEQLGRVQVAGDVVLFDDVQIEGVAEGVNMLPRQDYGVSFIELTEQRKYALARRR
jgi:predicted O-methyltransferase YrrM